MQLTFHTSCPSGKSPSLRIKVPGSQVFTHLPAALNWVIHPRVQFPISWMRETRLPPEHLFQTEAQCQSADKWLRDACCWGCWGCFWWAGGCNCLVIFLGPGLRTGSGRPCDTQLLWHRNLSGLSHWNLPSRGFCGMRSVRYNSDLMNGKAHRFLSRNPN